MYTMQQQRPGLKWQCRLVESSRVGRLIREQSGILAVQAAAHQAAASEVGMSGAQNDCTQNVF